MKKKFKSWKKGDVVEIKLGGGNHWILVDATVTGEQCWQCSKVSVANYRTKLGPGETCLNKCGPRGLCNLLRF